MREFVVSTESGSDLSQNHIAAHDIRIIPMYYTIAGEEYGAGKELPPEEFYGKMREGEVGAISVLARIRGRKKSIIALVDDMEETIGSWRDKQLRVGIVHADCIDDAKRLKEMVEERFGYDDVFIAPLGPTLGAHSGPGTLGLIFLADRR